MSDPNAKNKKRQTMLIIGAVGGIFALSAAGMFLFDGGTPQRTEKPKTVSITAPGSVDDKETWRAQESATRKATEQKVDELNGKTKTQSDELQKVKDELARLKDEKAKEAKVAGAAAPASATTTAAADPSALSKPLGGNTTGTGQQVLSSPNGKGGSTALNTPLNQVPEPPKRELEVITFGAAGGAKGAAAGSGSSGGTELLGFPTDEKAKRFATAPTKGEEGSDGITIVPASSFVRVSMLNGVDAPTGGQAQSNPLAVAFQVIDPANLPNKHRLDIRDCRFIAATWGDLSSERMMGRTETLTCVIDGESVEMPIKGTVIGEDGKNGVRGRLVSKQGSVLANALFAGALSGVGRAFQQSSSIVSTGGGGITEMVDPSRVAQAGIGGGVGSAANMLAQYYLKAADKLYPVIETDGGRVVEILVTKGAVYKGKALGRDRYRGLLSRSGFNSRSYQDD
ncbi:conjugal transfer protein TraI [Burkholderia cepacia]|uniref:TrbI/VirB10 family protein n=1 Tax=Burkholderia cepacia TaxID=292 RepID=UPI00075CEABB|nr:TrbI/VirB10 family protein [Burkholderia cepacia]KVV25068.1 conjugal transfer protein TraI [Burkholderia cepacia]